MSKISNMFAFFEKNKKQDNNMDEVGFLFPDKDDQPSNNPSIPKSGNTKIQNNNNNNIQKHENNISNKMKMFEDNKKKEVMFEDNKKKEVIINDIKNNEEKKIENKLTSNDETFDIFQRKEKKEEKKIVGLFADIGLFNESKSSFDKKEKKEEPKKTGDISAKMNMFESGNKNKYV